MKYEIISFSILTLVFLLPSQTYARTVPEQPCFHSFEYVIAVGKHTDLQSTLESKFIDGFVKEYVCGGIKGVEKINEEDVSGLLLKEINDEGIYQYKIPNDIIPILDNTNTPKKILKRISDETTTKNLYKEARKEFFVQKFNSYVNKKTSIIVLFFSIVVLIGRSFEPIFRNTFFTKNPRQKKVFDRSIFSIYVIAILLYVITPLYDVSPKFFEPLLLFTYVRYELIVFVLNSILTLSAITLVFKFFRLIFSKFKSD